MESSTWAHCSRVSIPWPERIIFVPGIAVSAVRFTGQGTTLVRHEESLSRFGSMLYELNELQLLDDCDRDQSECNHWPDDAEDPDVDCLIRGPALGGKPVEEPDAGPE